MGASARAKAAEAAVGQAATLLDAIDRADADLAAAPARIAERVTSLTADVADAQRLAPQDPSITQATTTAQETLASAQATGRDPLAAVAALQNAEATLDELLAPVRAAAEEAEKARIALTESLGRVTSRVRAVSDFVETRRGAVGAEARTRLSEAARHLDRAQQTLQSDPAGALAVLRQAEAYVDEAERLARTDVDRYESRTGSSDSMVLGGIFGGGSGSSSSGGWGGGWGGGSRSRSRSSSSRRSSSRRSSPSRRSGGSRGGRSRGGRF